MKSTVQYSTFNIVLTVIVIIILAIGLFFTWNTDKFSIICILSTLIFVFTLWYAPIYISVDDNILSIHALLQTRKLKISNIQSVELFQPAMGAMRLFGSGGFMGYWGLFKEGDVGNYVCFYGKSSECFLVRMKNGDKYVLGCKKPEVIVDYISSVIITRNV